MGGQYEPHFDFGRVRESFMHPYHRPMRLGVVCLSMCVTVCVRASHCENEVMSLSGMHNT